MREQVVPKPEWLKVRLPRGGRYPLVRGALSCGGLHTVCEEARCPNLAECWESGTATFLLLGDVCTRGCAFCAVERGNPARDLPPGEASRVAEAARRLELDYVVLTSVTRDDLPDGGAAVFAETVSCLRTLDRAPAVEVLIPDFLDRDLDAVLAAAPEVVAHNVEVVERLTPLLRHPRFAYRRSLEVLAEVRARRPAAVTKSSILLGLGERRKELLRTMTDLREAGVQILVLGQYLQPTLSRVPVVRYVPPQEFGDLETAGQALGFDFVAAGPLVRTSYRAAEAYVRGARRGVGEPATSPR